MVKLSKAGMKLVALLGGGQDGLKEGIPELGGIWLGCAKLIWLPCEAEGNEGGSRRLLTWCGGSAWKEGGGRWGL